MVTLTTITITARRTRRSITAAVSPGCMSRG
jgi:hypothetical protein